MTFGAKLQALRKQHNICQEELADKLQVSRSAISRWETDQCLPEVDKLLVISELFSVSLDYLLKDKPLNSDVEPLGSFISPLKLFTVCTIIDGVGLVASMYVWHTLQAPFLVVIGILMNIFACIFFEIFHPKEISKEKARSIRKQFYLANSLIILPTPIYIAIEVICCGEYYDIVAPHIIPFAIYLIAVIGIVISLIYQNKK